LLVYSNFVHIWMIAVIQSNFCPLAPFTETARVTLIHKSGGQIVPEILRFAQNDMILGAQNDMIHRGQNNMRHCDQNDSRSSLSS